MPRSDEGGDTRALEMPEAERRHRLQLVQHHLRRHDVHHWAASFLDALTEGAA